MRVAHTAFLLPFNSTGCWLGFAAAVAVPVTAALAHFQSLPAQSERCKALFIIFNMYYEDHQLGISIRCSGADHHFFLRMFASAANLAQQQLGKNHNDRNGMT